MNRKENQWFDQGLRKGGTIIDFGMAFYNCAISEFIEKINCRLDGLPLRVDFALVKFKEMAIN